MRSSKICIRIINPKNIICVSEGKVGLREWRFYGVHQGSKAGTRKKVEGR